MKFTIVGAGNMGWAVAGARIAQGHNVHIIDTDKDKVRKIQLGEPLYDEQMFPADWRSRITAATHAQADIGVDDVSTYLVCVPTPSAGGGPCDYSALLRVLEECSNLRCTAAPVTMVIMSTVAPGGMAMLAEYWRGAKDLIYHPVFLRAGYGVADYLAPEKVVIATRNGAPTYERWADEFPVPVRWLRWEQAEWVKLFHNAFMATKIAFANEAHRLCGGGADADAILAAVWDDRLLSRNHLSPGPPYGGTCLPKDMRILSTFVNKDRPSVIRSTHDCNENHANELLREWLLGPPPRLVIGLAYRPGLSDARESIALRFLEADAQAHWWDAVEIDPRGDPRVQAVMGRRAAGFDHFNTVFVNTDRMPASVKAAKVVRAYSGQE